MGVIDACTPREEVLQRHLDDAIFAANFHDVISGKKAPKVYRDAASFFENTHPTRTLAKVVGAVFERLANQGGGTTIRLSTGFGGGKTHTLLAMWHLAKNIGDLSLGTQLLPAAGRPTSVDVAAVDARSAGTEVFGRHGNVKTGSLWGELAYSFGKQAGLNAFAGVDNPEKQPDEALVEKMFPKGPALILLDELVIYMAALSERGQNNLLAFINKLMSVVNRRPHTALVITDPARQPVYAAEAAQLANELRAAQRLDDILGRQVTDYDPIGTEAAKVICCRLFSKVDGSAGEKASADYHALYRRVLEHTPGSLPVDAASPEYAKRIVECYPFHPRLLDTAQDRLGAMGQFNKSRGTFRLFARIIRDIWDSGENIALITAGEINWSSERIQGDLLGRLDCDQFRPAVDADVQKHATGQLDGGSPGVHRRVASALLLESLPQQAHSGMEPADLTLAVLRPDEAGPEPAEALDRLVSICWHTYPMGGGRGWQFRCEPNVNRLIEERAGMVAMEDARSYVLGEVQGYFSGPIFKLSSWPASARTVQELPALQLVLCESQEKAKAVLAYSDDSDPSAPVPRGFKNAVFAVAPTTQATLDAAVIRAQRLLAAEEIDREYRSSEQGKMIREQLRRIQPDLRKYCVIQSVRAFDRLLLAGGMSYPITEEYQVPEDKIMGKPESQAGLKRLLNDRGLVYQPGNSIDLPIFLGKLLPGATPVADKPGVYTAKAVHERLLSAPDMRLLSDTDVVRETLFKALDAGKIVIRTPDGCAYDDKGCVGGEAGRRLRFDQRPPSLPLDDNVLITTASTPYASEWLKVDEPKQPSGSGSGHKMPPPPEPAGPTRADNWEQVIQLAREGQMLRGLELSASTPADAATLIGLAQPLGADSLEMAVSTHGILKGGGQMHFQAEGIRFNHPAKPLDLACRIFRCMEDDSEYGSSLTLVFDNGGRGGLASSLSDMAEKASEGVSVRAVFEKRKDS